jgi:hypothetical protein
MIHEVLSCVAARSAIHLEAAVISKELAWFAMPYRLRATEKSGILVPAMRRISPLAQADEGDN